MKTYVKPFLVPGRNDPCNCGSGKKYKHCCIRKDQGAISRFLRKLRRSPAYSHRRVISQINRVPDEDNDTPTAPTP